MACRLIERNGDRAGAAHQLRPEGSTIGRGEDADIVVANDSVSRRHASVTWSGGQYVLTDLGSKNGTYLNGQRLTAAAILRHGDLVTVPGVTFAFDAADETATWHPEPPAPTGLRVDTQRAEVWREGRLVTVTAKEYLALVLLDERRGALVTKDELAARVWPEYQGDVGDANIEQLIFRLRRKLEADPQHPRYLLTVRGLGYRLDSPPLG